MKKDRKLVSFKQYWEPRYIAKRFGTTTANVREVAKKLGKNGKPYRGRGLIYAWFLANGYELHKV